MAVPMTTQQFLDLGKVPDFVRDVKPFNGNPTELVNWLADVDSIFRVYKEQNATTGQISVLERTIRRKIGGEAADILNANNIFCEWKDIKDTLVLYYRDKRDIKTLDYELTSIKKGFSETISTYYSRVNELLSYIIAQIQTDDKLKRNASVHIDYFREKSLDAFIRGLERPLSILLKSSGPDSLAKAYHFCVDYYNMDLRTAPYRNELGGQSTPKPKEPPRVPPRVNIYNNQSRLPPPPLPQRYPINPFHNQFPNPFRSHPQQTNPFRQTPFQQNIFKPYNQSPRQLPPPEPMEIDPSIRSRNVNYGNRPPFNMKRPFPHSQQQHNVKRQAHPLETADTSHNHDYGYAYEYDGYPPDEPYWDDSQYEQLYDEPEPTTCEIGEASGVNESEPNSSQSKESNFLEWEMSW